MRMKGPSRWHDQPGSMPLPNELLNCTGWLLSLWRAIEVVAFPWSSSCCGQMSERRTKLRDCLQQKRPVTNRLVVCLIFIATGFANLSMTTKTILCVISMIAIFPLKCIKGEWRIFRAASMQVSKALLQQAKVASDAVFWRGNNPWQKMDYFPVAQIYYVTLLVSDSCLFPSRTWYSPQHAPPTFWSRHALLQVNRGLTVVQQHTLQ